MGRLIAGTRCGASQTVNRPYTVAQSRCAMRVCGGGSDIRVVYGVGSGGLATALGLLPEVDVLNAVYLRCGISVDGGTTWHRVTFGGVVTGVLHPGGVELISDVVPLDVNDGTVVHVATRQWTAFGPNTTLAAAASAGASTVSLTAMPQVTSGWVTIGVGAGTQETVPIVSVTGSGPYTATLEVGKTLANAHSSGETVGMMCLTDRYLYWSDSESASNSTADPATVNDRTIGGSFSALADQTTTLSSAASAGDTEVLCAAILNSSSVTIGAQSIAVLNIENPSAPYRYKLGAALAAGASSGATVTASSAYTTTGFGPRALIAECPHSSAPGIVVCGDSITSGTGAWLDGGRSFIHLAFDSRYPIINTSIGGDRLTRFNDIANSIRRRRWLRYGDVVIMGYGHNDLVNSVTAAQLITALGDFAKLVHSRGARLAVVTKTPFTTSTDNWVTTTNQTVTAIEPEIIIWNAWLRSGAPYSIGVDFVIDSAAAVDSGTAAGGAPSGLWAILPNGASTGDGVHPSPAGHAAMAAAAAKCL